MRVGFAGTPAFAARALAALRDHGFTIPVVLTRPDRPFGRGMALRPSPVKTYAGGQDLTVLEPPSLRSESVQAQLRNWPLDVLVVAAYGLILPQPVLDWPRHGCLNIHASLLPRWRGAAPIARAIEAGDSTTGVSIMRMDTGLDTGPIMAMQAIPIGPRETAGSLTERLASLGAAMMIDALDALARGDALPALAQSTEGVTYAAKVGRGDTLIVWTHDARSLDRRIRALSPSPGAQASWNGKPVKVRSAIPLDAMTDAVAGAVTAVGGEGIDVACGEALPRSVLRLVELQPSSGRPMPAHAFAAGYRVAPGARFEPGR
ncbi:MAG TPA: methionyl-tRNA formyltransferase [Casimicrobiaceae bacterium]|nr:methionyl-tRNA formyltransferase [Casimicrobiaceae bacterium]